MIITISGQIGSGKSTLAKEIAKRFNLQYISAGEIMRSMATEKGMSLMEFSKFAELNSSVDREIDKKQKELAKNGNCVVEGRISAHFLDSDLKIFLITPLEIRAKRVMERDNLSTIEKAIIQIKEREESERKRYKKIYGIDFDDFSKYDIIINTKNFTKEKLADIVSAIVEKIKNEK
ncbi:MAG: AAA family ATPase [Candidatus Altiarchaeota archaeon]